MSHKPIKRSPARGRTSGRLFESESLNAMAQAALKRFVRAVARCGASPDEIVTAVEEACTLIPSGWKLRGLRATPEIGDASHVLTVWHSDIAYVTAVGKPRALPLGGPAPSITALVHGVDPTLDPRRLLAYLMRLNAVRRAGTRYVPRARSLLLRGQKGPDYFRTLRVLNGTLCTLDHNVENDDQTQGWFEYIAENSQYPVSERDALNREVRRQGFGVLANLDNFMHLKEKERKPDEPVMRVGLSFKIWEEDASDASPRPPRRSGRKRRRSRGG
jgi:hypothetical protein